MEHFTVRFEPDGTSISMHGGATILEAAEQAGIILDNICGGSGTCGKCAVAVEGIREKVLACQYLIDRDLTVVLEAGAKLFEQRILQQGIDRQIEIAPSIVEANPDLVKTPGCIFGVAVDIGTSTVVAKLLDMVDGSCKGQAAASNPQIRYGDDVISRIIYAQTDEGLKKLNKSIIDCINELINQLCEQAKIQRANIYEITVAANTTMNHILLKLPTKQLGQAPYQAYSVKAHNMSAKQAGIDINAQGQLYSIENIAGFVGADTTAVAVAVAIDQVEKMTLVVDIGTNGEIILGNKEGLCAASCAAGPAFEGARISQGSRAIEGSIERVIVNDDDIDIDVIGGGAAKSICGSGLIDAVAVLIELGLLDNTGKLLFANEVDANLPKKIIKRLVEKNGQPAFIFANNKNTNEPVILTQQDIRETQLAKAAIRSGIVLLQEKLNIADEDIEQVLLAGAFGNYIQRDSAKRIGLLPNVDVKKIHFIGNAACSGAEMVLLSKKARKQAKELSKIIEYVELANSNKFQTVFADCLMFDAK
jgi:uncharacterized 2Fe-2S/4Fe-4S cluster protein (DUF4445 family)